MKYVVAAIFCLLFTAVLATANDEFKEKLKAAKEKCQADPATAVDEAARREFIKSKGEGTPPANLGPYSLCISKNLGWQNADGTINKEEVKKRIDTHVPDPIKANEVINECCVEKENEIATAEHLIACVSKQGKPKDQN